MVEPADPMEVTQLREGLWRWTAPHPDWRPEKGGPGGWERMVGGLYCEPAAESADALVLIDPLAPPSGTPDADRFWSALDRDVERLGLPVAILLGNFFHERSAREVFEKYRRRPGAAIWAAEAARNRITCDVHGVVREGEVLPGGARAYSIDGLEESETAYYLPVHGALVFADALIGAGEGRARVAPMFWAENSSSGAARYRSAFRPSLRRLLDLPVEMLIVSHGEPVRKEGHRALAAALDAPAWGEA